MTSQSIHLECHDAIVPDIGVGGVHRRAEAAVLACEVVFRDPKGTATGLSNRDSDVTVSKEVHQLLQWRHTNTLDLGRNAVLN